MNIGVEKELKPGTFVEGQAPENSVVTFVVSMDPSTAAIFNFFSGGTFEDFSNLLEGKLKSTINELKTEMESLRKKPVTISATKTNGTGRGRRKAEPKNGSNGKESTFLPPLASKQGGLE